MRFKWLLVSGFFFVGVLLLPFSYSSHTYTSPFAFLEDSSQVAAQAIAADESPWAPQSLLRSVLRQVDGVLEFTAQAIEAITDAPNELFEVVSNDPPETQEDVQGFDPLINAANQLPAVTAPQAYEGTLIFNVPVSMSESLTVGGVTQLSDLFVSGEFSIENLTVPGAGSFGSVSAGGLGVGNAQVGSLAVSGDTQLNTLSVLGPVSFANVTAGNLAVTNNLTALGGIETQGADVDLGSGNIFAANIVNEIIAGDDIEITGPPNAPIISADVRVPSLGSRVRRINDLTGTLTLVGGSGILVTESGNEITIANSSGLGTYLGLTDTPGSYVTGALPFVNATGSALTQSTSLTFNGSQLTVGSTTPVTTLTVDGDASILNQQALRLYETGSTNFVGFRASTTLAGDIIWTLPAADGNANDLITTDGVGNLRFVDPAVLGFVSELDDLTDVTITASTTGDILRFNGSQWVNASSGSLGLGDNTYVGLTDTPGSLQANAIPFASSSGAALTQSADFVFDGSQLAVGTSSPITTVTINGDTSLLGAQAIRFYESDNSSHVGFRASTTLAGDTVWTLPAVDGNTNEFIVTDGAGNLRFADASVLGGVTQLDDLTDVTLSTTTQGDMLVYNGTEWVNQATTTLGLGDGTFLGLADTPGSYTSDAVLFANAAGSAVAQSANFTFDGTQVSIGGAAPVTTLTVDGDVSLLGAQAVRFYEASNTNYVSFQASTSLAGDVIWTLPPADGSNDQVLVTDGSGNLRFADVSAIGGGATNYLDLNDTPSTYTEFAIPHVSSSTIAFSTNLTFDGFKLGVRAPTSTHELTVHGSAFIGFDANTPGIVYDNVTDRVAIGATSSDAKLNVEGGSILQRAGRNGNTHNVQTVSSIDLPDTTYDVFILGTRAYVVSGSSGDDFHVIDIGDRNNPVEIGSVNLPANANSVYVAGKYAYAVTDVAGDDFHVIDVSDPTSPSEVASIGLSTSATGVTVQGRYAYVTTNNTTADFHIIDIADPLNPVEVGTVDLPSDANDVMVRGDYAYVVTDATTHGFAIIDISTSTAPSVVGTTSLPTTANDLDLQGDYAYVVTDASGDDFHVVDISDPTAPSVFSSLNLVTSANSVAVAGNFAYVATAGTGDDFHIIDVSNLSSPTLVGGAELASGSGLGVAIRGRYAYMVTSVTGDSFHVLDATGVEAQTVLAHSLESGNLSVLGDIIAAGNLSLSESLRVGEGGIRSEGVLLVEGTADSFFTGSVGIGTTSPADKLDVKGDIRVGTGTTGCVKDADGTTIAGTCSSDERLKTEIIPLGLGSTEYLEAVAALEPVTYKWNEIAGDLFTYGGVDTQTGLIAQQVEGVLPELVANSSDGFKQVRFSDIPIYLIQAIKEMWSVVTGNQEKIESLEDRVKQLETMLDVEPTVSDDKDDTDDDEPTEEGDEEDETEPVTNTATSTATSSESTEESEEETESEDEADENNENASTTPETLEDSDENQLNEEDNSEEETDTTTETEEEEAEELEEEDPAPAENSNTDEEEGNEENPDLEP